MSFQNPNIENSQINALQTECRDLLNHLGDAQTAQLTPVLTNISDRITGYYVSQAELEVVRAFLHAQQFDTQNLSSFLEDLSQATPVEPSEIYTDDSQSILLIQKSVRDQAIQHLKDILDSPSKQLLHSNTPLQQKIDELSAQSDTIHEIFESLKQHSELKHLDGQDLELIATFNPESPFIKDRIQAFLDDKSISSTSDLESFITEKLEKATIESLKFRDMLDDLQEIFENNLSEINKHKVKLNNIELVERSTGLKIQENNKYFYLDGEGNQHNFNIKSITTLETKDALEALQLQTSQMIDQIPQLNGHTFETLLTHTNRNQFLDDIIQQEPSHEKLIQELKLNLDDLESLKYKIADNVDIDYIYDNFQTIVELEGDLPYGNSDTLTVEQFGEFLTDIDARELIESHEQLMQNIEYNLYGQTIKIGTELQVCLGFQDATKPDDVTSRTTFKVTNIENGLLTLVDESNQESQMSFPEFAKWYRQNRVEENVDLYRARQILANQPSALRAKYAHLTTGEEFSSHPITITKGEVLHARDGSHFTIKEIEDTEEGTLITLDNDRTFSIPEFVDFCKEYELQNFDLEKPEELPNGETSEPAKDKAKKKNKKAAWFLPLVKNVFFDPLALLEIQLVSFNEYAQIASMAKDIYTKNLERKDKERLNRIGKTLPGELGRRFADEESSIIGEKIKAESDRIASDTVYDVISKLKNPDDRYKARAYMDFLSEKGMLNMEDPNFHKALNKLLRKHKDVVIGNSGKAPNEFFINEFGISKSGRTAKASTKAALDALYGKGTGDEISSKQERSYNSEVDSYKAVIKEEFFKVGGLGPEMHEILEEFVAGRDIHPAKFEGYLSAGISNGFLTGDEVLFFVIAGMAAKSKNGTTLLTDSYISKIQRKEVPQLDYLARLKGENGEKLWGMCPEILKYFQHRPGKKPPYNKDRVAEFVRLETSSIEKTKDRVSAACANSFDKEYTGYAFPAAKPETMYGMIGVDSPYSGIKFDEVQVSDSLEGFNKTLDQIARFENGDTNLAKLSSCKYAKLSEEARAKNLAEVLGSWYVIFSNLDDNIATAYNNRSNIGNYNISKIRFLEPIKSFLPVILKECDVPVEYHKYLMGVEPIPTENSGARKYVSEFYKNLRNIAASNPSKFLGLIKGREFTKD